MELTLNEYKRYTIHLLKDFDIKVTDEIKSAIKSCKNPLEIEKIRDGLINQRLKEEQWSKRRFAMIAWIIAIKF